MTVLIDNDILLKGACYRLLAELITDNCGTDQIGYLAAARFVLTRKIRQANLRGDAARAEAELLEFLAEHIAIETTMEEKALAASLEATAQSVPVNLDTGESQLLAALILRTLPRLLTGDKRAIITIELLIDAAAEIAGASGKITCLEQLMRNVVMRGDVAVIRATICGEPAVDRALSICFSCSNPEPSKESVAVGLESYIADLRRKAPRALSI